MRYFELAATQAGGLKTLLATLRYRNRKQGIGGRHIEGKRLSAAGFLLRRNRITRSLQ